MNVIIIPAYKPDGRLTTLVYELIKLQLTKIVVVDDGSGIDFVSLFKEIELAGCCVIHLEYNSGKGAAIKAGIRHANEQFNDFTGYVTCDADGQHLAIDILKVSKALGKNPHSLVLGSRDLSLENVPLKSRLGNKFSSIYFKLVTGVTCTDTQTGLRGIPYSFAEIALGIPEDHYDFEMAFLIRVVQDRGSFVSVPVSTVYEDNNSSTHFKPIIDSFKIYKEPIKFTLASITSAVVDLGIFTLLIWILNKPIFILVVIASISARVISGVYNFVINRIWSFQNFEAIKPQFKKYFILYIGILLLSISFVTILSFLPIHLTIIKILVDGLLFICSFIIQKKWVFVHKKMK